MENILLIDGKNTAYRALFASRGNREFRTKGYHPFTTWVKLSHVWLEKFKPSSAHVFWDCPKNEVWRKKLLSEYKDHRDAMPHYDNDVQEQLHKLIDAASAILSHMGVRQYTRPGQEADDLIYSACRLLTPTKSDTRKLIVISSDSDFAQLQWYMPYVSVYDPRKNKFIDSPECNPAVQKALCGDRADNIDGFRGIGPVKSNQIASDPKKLIEFLDLSDARKFKRNLALIDLSMNPSRLNNELYMLRVLSNDAEFDKAAINQLSIDHKIRGLMSEYPNISLEYKRLK